MSPEKEITPNIIRDITPEDIPSFLDIVQQSYLDSYIDDEIGVTNDKMQAYIDYVNSPSIRPMFEKRLAAAAESPDCFMKIALDGSDPAGVIFMSKHQGFQVLEGLVVDKTHLGTGLAKNLMDEAMTWADPKRSIVLEVVSYYDRAISFYKKYGFEVIEGSDHIVDNIFQTIDMVRRAKE